MAAMRSCFLLALLLSSSLCAVAAPFDWQTSTPADQGLSGEKVEAYRENLAKHKTHSILVIRHDKIVLEWYAEGYGPDKPHGTASMAKGVVGGMSFAVAMQDGRCKADDFAWHYVPQWKDDPKKSKITLAQLATHSSGLEDAEEDKIPHAQLTGWKGDFWKRKPDPFTLSRDDAPVMFTPGEKVSYSNTGIAMLAYAVTAAIQPGKEKDIRTLLRDRIYRPIGMTDKQWSVGYGETNRVEGLNLVGTWGGAAFTPRAAARIGRLMLREGDWDGQRLLDASVVRLCVEAPNAPQAREWEGPCSPRPGFGWWTNRDNAWKSTPRDAFLAAGAGNQLLVVIPSLDMVVVRNGTTLSAEPNWLSVEKYVLAPLMEAVVDPPYRPSNVIRKIEFAPEDSIIRKALDSDNWPVTWGDDDNLYTAYGDGKGFEPFVEKKLSLGLARIEGTPPDFRGVNIRSASAERTGGGANGPKASGMLMVDGILYMWVRNTGNSTLAWSADHGATWTWGFKFDKSFGCPTFLNFGRNYAGAMDDYVYAYSQDGPGAYEPYDGVVLARVHKAKIKEREAYEFFSGSAANPKWERDIDKRGHVFAYPTHCERLDAVYNPGIGRYLLTVSFGHGKGWGIFDAPKPWGPWTTAYVTHDWGLGDTHGYRLPSKWISGDGRTMWMIFSGRRWKEVDFDACCVRRMTIDVYPK
jgi:CubicO group peptidase (beta-lactamase class C family)